MTIWKQNAINSVNDTEVQIAVSEQQSRVSAIVMPDEGSIEQCIYLSESTVSRVDRYLKTHGTMSWDEVVETALENFLATTV